MTKQEYLSAIRGKIRKMPADDINKFMDYYSEMIDDRMEDGLSEEDAVADMDAPDDVVDQILADMPLTKLVKEKIKPSHRLKAWEIILLILRKSDISYFISSESGFLAAITISVASSPTFFSILSIPLSNR